MQRFSKNFSSGFWHASLLLGFLAWFAISTHATQPLAPSLLLSAPSISSNRFNFLLNVQSGASYIIQGSSNFVTWTNLATNSSLGASRTITITNPPMYQGFYRAIPASQPVYRFALAALNGIALTGNARVDSYDSSVAPYDWSSPHTNAWVATASRSVNAISLLSLV